ncbi:MAG: HAD family hydrolase [Oscillospiraceae bacterium]|nr:HAD family hydrolase [Oscillospiraceae bacterium]
MYKLCAFDLDGTLVDTVHDIAAAANYGLEKMGLPTHPTESYYRFVGNGMQKICERALPEGRKDKTEELMKIYAERYMERCCELSEPYEGVRALLERLGEAGLCLAVVSNKPHEQTVRVVSHYFPGIEFFEVLGASERLPRKPQPEMLLSVIAKGGFLEGETLYIGDSDVDVLFAHAARVPCLGVSWGFRGRGELESAGAEYIVDSAAEIEAIALGLK